MKGASGEENQGEKPGARGCMPLRPKERAVPAPVPGQRALRQEALISRVTASTLDFLLQHQIYSPADHSPPWECSLSIENGGQATA